MSKIGTFVRINRSVYSILKDISGKRQMAKTINEAIEEYLVENHIDIDKLDLLIDEANAEIDLINAKIAKMEREKAGLLTKIERYRSRKQFILTSQNDIDDILHEITSHFLTYCESKERHDIRFWEQRFGGSYITAIDPYLDIMSKKISNAKNRARSRGAILTNSAIRNALIEAASEKDNLSAIKKASELIKV